MNRLFLYFFTLVLLLHRGNTANQDNMTLELVQVIFRHGARTPLQRSLDYFTSANRSIYEPWGIGVLTTVGKQQAHNLGLFLRRRYNDQLSANYKAEEIYAYSSAEDRTKTTMELVLAGLYPPSGSAVWNSSLLWSPVPYKFTPKELDVMLRGYELPKFLKLLERVRQSSEHQQKLKEFQDALKILDEKTGVKATANFSTLTYIFDILYANEYINSSLLPSWYTPEIRDTLIDVQKQEYDDFASTEEMRKIGIGLLVRNVVKNMNLNKTTNNPRKIYLYSGHESGIALLTRVHGVRQFRYPHYGNAVIHEKWRDSVGQVYVRLLAWTGSENLLTLKLGNCADFCPIEDYLKIVTPAMLPDSEVEDILREYSVNQLQNFFFEDTVVTKS